jgi:hypothetical protein
MQVIEAQCSWSWRLTITSISNMSASLEVTSATQITRSGAAMTVTLAALVADQIGGSMRVVIEQG